MDAFWTIIGSINGMLFSDYTIYALLISGVAFTIWSGFGQYYALVHGTAVVRGKYDNHDDPGAISHFQALSTALSATVGLGNIGGVAVAVALGHLQHGASQGPHVAGLGPRCVAILEHFENTATQDSEVIQPWSTPRIAKDAARGELAPVTITVTTRGQSKNRVSMRISSTVWST